MKISRRAVENIKTSIIVVLSLSTVLLLYFFWYQTPYDKFKQTEAPSVENQISVKELVIPQEIVVSFGDENFCVFNQELSNLWYSSDTRDYSIIDEFKKFSASENIFVEEISKEKYDLAKDFRYVKANLGYSIPFSELCDTYEIKKPTSFNSIESMTSLMYSEGSKAGMFISDDVKGKYYWLFSDKDVTTFSRVIELIEERQHNIYYPLGTFLGVDNNTLISVHLEQNIGAFPYKQEIYTTETDSINRIAKKFFGENFDFIKKIIEGSGKVIYMYGYGEKVFVVNVDGSMEYREEFKAENFASKKFFESLQIASNFIVFNGGFQTLSGTSMKPFLKDAVPLKDKSGYVFTFGEIINDNVLSYKAGQIIEVEIVGEQITSYKRDMVDYNAEDININGETRALYAIDMITQNYEYIYQAMIETGSYGDETIDLDVIPDFEAIASRISVVDTGYVRDESSLTVRPAWILTAGKAKIFLDLYEYTPISFTKAVD